jgi:hypothetical protein
LDSELLAQEYGGMIVEQLNSVAAKLSFVELAVRIYDTILNAL